MKHGLNRELEAFQRMVDTDANVLVIVRDL